MYCICIAILWFRDRYLISTYGRDTAIVIVRAFPLKFTLRPGLIKFLTTNLKKISFKQVFSKNIYIVASAKYKKILQYNTHKNTFV